MNSDHRNVNRWGCRAEEDPVPREQPLAQGLGLGTDPGVMWAGLFSIQNPLMALSIRSGRRCSLSTSESWSPRPIPPVGREEVREEDSVGIQGSTEGTVRRLCMSGARMRSRGNHDLLHNTTFLNVQIYYY